MARVLVVEDSAANRMVACELLEGAGHEVTGCRDAETGIAWARAQRPDLIVMDTQLPGIDGLTAAKILKRDVSTRRIRIVGVTAHALRGDCAAALRAGCDGLIAKPLRAEELLDAVRRALSRDESAGPKEGGDGT